MLLFHFVLIKPNTNMLNDEEKNNNIVYSECIYIYIFPRLFYCHDF